MLPRFGVSSFSLIVYTAAGCNGFIIGQYYSQCFEVVERWSDHAHCRGSLGEDLGVTHWQLRRHSVRSTRLYSDRQRQPQIPKPETKRKKKNNKYSKFSKVEVQEKDPLEQMIEESEQKLARLQQEQANARKKISNIDLESVPPPKSMSFPTDISNIDPYDPSTFGYVEIGTIISPHGVHGWTKVQARTDYPERLTRAGTTLHCKFPRKRAPRRVTLACGKDIGNEQFLIQLQNIYDRDSAQKLQGATLYYATQQDTLVGADGSDDYLVTDLVGFEVLMDSNNNDNNGGDNDDMVVVGTVLGIVLAEEMCAIPSLGHDMLEVELKRDRDPKTIYGKPPKLVLIPMVPEIVPRVDLDSCKVHIDPPSGLLNLTYEREVKVVIKGLLPEKSSFGM